MKKLVYALSAVAVCFICLFCFNITNTELVFYADKEQSLEEAKENLQEAKDKLTEIKNSLSQLGNNKEKLLEKKSLIEYKIDLIENQIKLISSDLIVIEGELEEKSAELAVVQNEYDLTLDKFKGRARASYEAGTQSYLEAILTSTDLSDLLTRIDLIQEVAEYDKSLLNGLSEKASKIEVLVNEIKDRKALKEEELEIQAEAEADLITSKESLQDTIRELNSDMDELAHQQAEWESKREQYEKEIADLAGNGTYYGDEFCWPVPSSSRITSGFGWRTYHHNGKVVTNFHHAIDIGAPIGTKVIAAGDGTVLRAQWVTTGGGKQVVVDHGSKLLTYYNHLNGFNCHQGQKVQRGQHIAYVGATGNVTGPHLDFAIMYKGKYQNPSLYVNYGNHKPKKSIHDLIGN